MGKERIQQKGGISCRVYRSTLPSFLGDRLQALLGSPRVAFLLEFYTSYNKEVVSHLAEVSQYRDNTLDYVQDVPKQVGSFIPTKSSSLRPTLSISSSVGVPQSSISTTI